MADIYTSHQAEYNEQPEVIVSVPGVLTFMGEYSDLSDGFAITGAVEQSIEIAISKRKDSSLRFFATEINERKRTTIPNLKYRREDRWANYIKGVLHEVYRRNYEFKGLNITVNGDVTKKVGIKGSTALCTGAAIALRKLFNFDVDDNQLIQAIYFAETSFLQEKARLIDIMTMLYAKKGFLMKFDLHSLDFSYIPLDLGVGRLLVTDSGIPPLSIRDEVLHREEECQIGFSIIRSKFPGGLLRELTPGDVKSVAALLTEEQKRFCIYALEESYRTLEAVHALEQKDRFAYGRIMNRIQSGLRDNFEVSCPEVDWLTKRAMEINGCHGSNMIGPGFGGSTITLLDEDKVSQFTEKMEEYEHIFGFHAEWFIYEPMGKARILLP